MQDSGDKNLVFNSAAFSLLLALFVLGYASVAHAQVNSGSDGHDGVLNPTTNTVVNMADHPDGIYHYTSVHISNNVTVTFIPNANNSPVVWLVQGDCTISGAVSVDGMSGLEDGRGGPGGFRGGAPGGGGVFPGEGNGPGGGTILSANSFSQVIGGNASFASLGNVASPQWSLFDGRLTFKGQAMPGITYGNQYLVPLLGGSGGSGVGEPAGGYAGRGGGGGGALLIVVSNTMQLNGNLRANGGSGGCQDQYASTPWAGSGSGGSIRLVSTHMRGAGSISVTGGTTRYTWFNGFYSYVAGTSAGNGFARLDSLDNEFSGNVDGPVTRGFQPIIIPPPNQAIAMSILSVAGVTVPSNPAGSLVTPDVTVPSNQQNPVSIVVQCGNIPLNTEIIVEVKPANGPTVRAVGINNTGTQASSMATVSMNIPRGGGTIQAKAVSGIADNLYGSVEPMIGRRSLAQTGLTADGERFLSVEVTAALGGQQKLVYLTKSGKRYPMPAL